MRSVFLTLMAIMVFQPAYGDDVSKRKVAEDIVNISGLAENMEKMQNEMGNVMGNVLLAKLRQRYTCIPDSFVQDFTNISLQYVRFEQLKGHLVDFYTEDFTEDELKEIYAFRSSPVGQKELKDTPAIMKKMEPIIKSTIDEHKKDTQEELKTLLSKYVSNGKCLPVKNDKGE